MEPDITRGSTWEGSICEIRLTARSTRCSVLAMSTPYVNSASTIEAPVFDVAVVFSRFGTERSAVSMGSETSLFTTSGEAPG